MLATISHGMQQHVMNMVAPVKKGLSAGSLMVSLAGIPIHESIKTPAIPINGTSYYHTISDHCRSQYLCSSRLHS